MMKSRFWVVLVVGVLWSACTDDARVLWERSVSTGGAGTSIAVSSTGADVGGFVEPPLPPDLPFCNETPVPSGVPCTCLPAEPCMCMPSEPEMEILPCQMVCDGGGCELICDGPSPCDTECVDGCAIQCEPGSICSSLCANDCVMYCEQGAECHLWSYEGPSQMFCFAGSVCDCTPENNCLCEGIGCP